MPVQSDYLLFAIPLDYTLFVEADLLGAEIRTTVGEHTAFVRFPSVPPDPPAERIVLQAPLATPRALSSHVDSWGMARNADPGAETHALVVAVEAHASIDWEIEEFPAAGKDVTDISRAVHAWLSRYMQWIFCLTAQSLDVQNPDPKTIHRSSTNMIQVLTAESRCSRPQVASVLTPIVVDFEGGPSSERALPRDLAELASIRSDTHPPLMLELLASARMFLRRRDRRRALIDAGGAAESALIALLGSKYDGQTLGSLVNICRSVEIDAGVNLVAPRNDAVHRGIAPTAAVAMRALEIVESLVLQVESSVKPSVDLRHINRPQRTDLVIIRPSEKMVQLAKNREEGQQEDE